jgi:hypothetical protein
MSVDAHMTLLENTVQYGVLENPGFCVWKREQPGRCYFVSKKREQPGSDHARQVHAHGQEGAHQ